MKLIVGLGNPGQNYMNNRHNAGHLFIDFLNDHLIAPQAGIRLAKTDCFMNLSGRFVEKHLKRTSTLPNDLFIAHDDLDIPLGSFKIQFASGPKIHNGIHSVEDELGTDEFWRIRLGVDSRPPGGPRTISGEDYVLSDFAADEREQLTAVFAQVAMRLKSI